MAARLEKGRQAKIRLDHERLFWNADTKVNHNCSDQNSSFDVFMHLKHQDVLLKPLWGLMFQPNIIMMSNEFS
jgi:hypothetical protein